VRPLPDQVHAVVRLHLELDEGSSADRSLERQLVPKRLASSASSSRRDA